jgi:glycolate oxidase iron-sulfur subunit
VQTVFSAAQLADPEVATSEAILRSCVHCGFCTATCPTYVLLGDELDSPRGRIYQMKEMLEAGGPPTPQTVKHVDRCLSCLSCMTTCPSGVHYMHLVDHARTHIEATYRRPLPDRLLRELLARVLPSRILFRLSLRLASMVRPIARLAPGRLKGLLAMAPAAIPVASTTERPGVFKAQGPRKLRVGMLAGCAQAVLGPGVNEAVVRLLNRHGVEVVVSPGTECCGALTHHLGKADRSHASAKAAIAGWIAEADGEGLDAIVIAASGCGTTVKDYGHMFRSDPEWAAPAARVAALAKDITELMTEVGLNSPAEVPPLTVAYHSACSMQHGQGIRLEPKQLLERAGFKVKDVPEGHLCCGSAGTYNILQPELATRLRERKVANIERLNPDVIATGNIGCITQIAAATRTPIVHTAELLDWATGGPRPPTLEQLS